MVVGTIIGVLTPNRRDWSLCDWIWFLRRGVLFAASNGGAAVLNPISRRASASFVGSADFPCRFSQHVSSALTSDRETAIRPGRLGLPFCDIYERCKWRRWWLWWLQKDVRNISQGLGGRSMSIGVRCTIALIERSDTIDEWYVGEGKGSLVSLAHNQQVLLVHLCWKDMTMSRLWWNE
jgi:hypothetical protein